MERKQFCTGDLFLAAAISIKLDLKPDLSQRRGTVFFDFPSSDALYIAVAEYNGGMELVASEYALAIKELRAAMYAAKGGRNGNQ